MIPNIDLLSHFQGGVIDAMMRDVFEAASTHTSLVNDTAESLIGILKYNEEQTKAAYSHIFKFLSDQEGETGPGWMPSMTGLHLTLAPPGKGRSMWVSAEGKLQFQMHGEGAIMKIPEDK